MSSRLAWSQEGRKFDIRTISFLFIEHSTSPIGCPFSHGSHFPKFNRWLKSPQHILYLTHKGKEETTAKGHYVLTSLPHVTETGISKLEEMEILGWERSPRERKDGQVIHKNSRGSISPGVVVLPMPMPMTQHSRAELASVTQGCQLQQEQRLSSGFHWQQSGELPFPLGNCTQANLGFLSLLREEFQDKQVWWLKFIKSNYNTDFKHTSLKIKRKGSQEREEYGLTKRAQHWNNLQDLWFTGSTSRFAKNPLLPFVLICLFFFFDKVSLCSPELTI